MINLNGKWVNGKTYGELMEEVKRIRYDPYVDDDDTDNIRNHHYDFLTSHSQYLRDLSVEEKLPEVFHTTGHRRFIISLNQLYTTDEELEIYDKIMTREFIILIITAMTYWTDTGLFLDETERAKIEESYTNDYGEPLEDPSEMRICLTQTEIIRGATDIEQVMLQYTRLSNDMLDSVIEH